MKSIRTLSFVSIVLLFYGCCITRPNCDPDNGNFSYGPEISYRTSSYYGADARDADVKYIGSVGFGIFASWIFCEDYPEWGLNSGLFYNQFGAKYGDEFEESKERIKYLTIPFTFTYEFYEGFRAEAGPDLAFLVGAKEIYEYNGQKETYDFKEDVRNFQLGYTLGVSYTHEPTGLGGYFHYNGGFTNVPISDYDTKFRNGGFTIGVRYRINQYLYRGK